MSVVPPEFAAMIAEREGQAGEAWLAGLPDRVAALVAAWRLHVDGPTMFGYVGIVVPVLRADSTPAVLKVSYPDAESAGEAPALAAWNGGAAVRLLERDDSGFALLLERLDPDRSLFTVDVDQGLDTLGALLAELHTVIAPAEIPTLAAQSERWLDEVPRDWTRLCGLEDRRLLDAAVATYAELGPVAGDRLLHGDLHYGNVLAGGRRPWLAIDPKGLAGDPAYELIPAVWNRLDDLLASHDPAAAVRARVDRLCEVAGIDREHGYRWTVARAVENLTWARDTGNDQFGGAEILIASALLRL